MNLSNTAEGQSFVPS